MGYVLLSEYFPDLPESCINTSMQGTITLMIMSIIPRHRHNVCLGKMFRRNLGQIIFRFTVQRLNRYPVSVMIESLNVRKFRPTWN